MDKNLFIIGINKIYKTLYIKFITMLKNVKCVNKPKEPKRYYLLNFIFVILPDFEKIRIDFMIKKR